MADNANVTEGDGTLIVAADEIGGAKYQRVKIAWGVDGAATDASASAPFPVVQTGTPELATDAATQTTLAAVLAKLSADPSTETTLTAILAKIIAAPATSAKQDALAALIGEVQASPTSNTLLDRLKAIATALAATLTVSGTVTANIGTVGTLATAAKQDTQITAEQAILAKIIAAPATEAKQDTGNTSIASIDTKTPALGQAVAGSSVPVVLPAAQITTLTPPAAITGFATETTLAAASAKLPAALGANGGLKIEGVASGTVVPVSDGGGSLTVDGSLTTVSTVTTITNVVHVDDNSSTISIDDGAGSITVDGTVAVSGTVAVTDNSGSLTVDNGGTFAVQAAQSGTWNITNVSGTVSLPTGAATSAKQPALGTAGAASTDVITVQGIASGVAQPASQSGTWTIQPGNTQNTTPWLVSPLATAIDVALTRPSDTTAYAANDEISSSTSAPSVNTITGAARASGGYVRLLSASCVDSSNVTTKAQLVVYLFDTTTTPNNDNAAFAPGDSVLNTCVGILPFNVWYPGDDTSGATGNAISPYLGPPIEIKTVGSANLFFRVKVLNAYVPTSAEVFTFRFTFVQY